MFVTKASKGTTTYTFAHKVAALVENVTSFSNKPLVFIFYLGAAIFIISSSAAVYLVIDRVFFHTLLAGWASVIVSIWMLGGLTIFCLGLIGIYISKIYIETKQRPYTIIRKIYDRHPATCGPSGGELVFHAALPASRKNRIDDFTGPPKGDQVNNGNQGQ
jgi:putative glycosyltransferase